MIFKLYMIFDKKLRYVDSLMCRLFDKQYYIIIDKEFARGLSLDAHHMQCVRRRVESSTSRDVMSTAPTVQ